MLLVKRDGAITVFLSIILASVLILTSVFVEAARIRSAETQIQNAVDISANSTLTDYNNVLKDMFGLMAISDNDPQKLKEQMAYYLERTLSVSGLKDKKSSNYFDLYGFNMDELNVTPIYNLSEPEVLRTQILEYMKYKAPKELAEGFLDKIFAFKDFKKQADTMKKKVEVDQQLEDLRKTQEKASDNVLMVNSFGKMPEGASGTGIVEEDLSSRLIKAADIIVAKIGFEKLIKDLQKQIDDLKKSKVPIQDDIAKLRQQISEKKKNATEEKPADTTAEESKIAEDEAKLDAIDGQITQIQSALKVAADSFNSKASELYNLKKTIDDHISESLIAGVTANSSFTKIQKDSPEITGQIDKITASIKDDSSDFADKTRTDLGGKKVKIDVSDMDQKKSQVSESLEKINNVKSILNQNPMDKLSLDSFGGTVPDVRAVKTKLGVSQIVNILGQYNGYVNTNTAAYKPIDYVVLKQPKTDKKDQKDPRDFAKEQVKKVNTEVTDNDSKITDDVYKELPSLLKSSTETNKEVEADKKYVDEMLSKMKVEDYIRKTEKTSDTVEPNVVDADPESAKKMLGGLDDIADFLTNSLLSIRDEVYIDEYAMGTFKNYTSGKGEETEYDLRGEEKSKRVSAFLGNDRKTDNNAEIEYILWGKQDINKNVNCVKTEILVIRFILNTISIYTDPQKFNMAMEAAWVIAGWTGGIGVPLVHTLIMLAWSMAESVIDVNLLLSGKSVPIFKTPNTWILSPQGGLTYIKEAASMEIKKATDHTIDYISGEAQDKIEKVAEQINESIKVKIGQAVDKAFSVIEGPFEQMTNSFNSTYDGLTNSITDYANSEVSDTLKQIDQRISELVPDFFNQFEAQTSLSAQYFGSEYTGVSYEKAIISMENRLLELEKDYSRNIAGKSQSQINKLKADLDAKKADIISRIQTAISTEKKVIVKKISGKITNLTSDLTNKITDEIKKLSNAAKEKTGQLLDNVGGKTTGGSSKTNLKASFLSMKYTDYLRLFLLMTNSDKKIKRIGDLIQLQMQRITKNDGFKLSEANTYLRVNTKVSMKYFFMAQPLIPKEYRTPDGKRHEFNITLYKGY